MAEEMKADIKTDAPKQEHAKHMEHPKHQKNAPPRRSAPKSKAKREKTIFTFKLFDKWDCNVPVGEGLRSYINLEPRMLPRSAGVHRNRFHKSKMHIVERLALKLMVAGHIGKRHRLTSGVNAGNYSNVMKVVENALNIIEQKEKKNPLEILVKAVENAAVREEVVSYQLGSIIAREAVVTSPQRRVDKALKYFAQGSFRAGFGKKKTVAQALADELMAAARGGGDSFAVKEKERMEKEAAGAR